MIKKVAFTAYKVKDLKRARAFYEDTLGLGEAKNYHDRWFEYDLPGGGCFAITNMGEEWEPSATSGGSVAFEVEDVTKMVSNLKSKGVTIKMDVFDSPVCKMAVIVDSEGNSLMLHQLTNR